MCAKSVNVYAYCIMVCMYCIDYPMSIWYSIYIINLLHKCTEPELLRVKASPLVVMSGDVINVTCGAVPVQNGQVLYNAMYQFFFNESPIGVPTNSSYIMVNATSSGDFKCNATQYSDQGTSVPSPQSAAVQAIVLGESVFMQYNIKYKHHKNNVKSYLSVLDSITCVVSCKPAVYFYMNNIICAIYVQLCAYCIIVL